MLTSSICIFNSVFATPGDAAQDIYLMMQLHLVRMRSVCLHKMVNGLLEISIYTFLLKSEHSSCHVVPLQQPCYSRHFKSYSGSLNRSVLLNCSNSLYYKFVSCVSKLCMGVVFGLFFIFMKRGKKWKVVRKMNIELM